MMGLDQGPDQTIGPDRTGLTMLHDLLSSFFSLFFSVGSVWWTKLANSFFYCTLNTQYRIMSYCIVQLVSGIAPVV